MIRFNLSVERIAVALYSIAEQVPFLIVDYVGSTKMFHNFTVSCFKFSRVSIITFLSRNNILVASQEVVILTVSAKIHFE